MLTAEQAKERALVEVRKHDQAKRLLADAKLDDLFAVIPLDQLASMYERFMLLTRLGQSSVEEWASMPKEVSDLKHAIFRQSDFGAVFAGQWLPKALRDATREKVRAQLSR